MGVYVFVCQREGGGGSGAYNFVVVVILPCGFNLIDLNFPAGRGGGAESPEPIYICV